MRAPEVRVGRHPPERVRQDPGITRGRLGLKDRAPKPDRLRVIGDEQETVRVELAWPRRVIQAARTELLVLASFGDRATQESHEVDEPTAVAPLVVVPAQHLDQPVHAHRQLAVEDA
jgi:hypothetical protein